MYIIFGLLAVIIIILSMRPKKKLNYRNNKKFVDRLNEKLSRLHYKKDSNNYRALQQRIINAGISVGPETFQTVRLILPLAVMILYILFNIINYLNLKLSIENLAEAAKVLKNETILNINLNINVLTMLLIGAVTLLLPDLIVRFMGAIRTEFSKREALILQTYTIILLRTTKPIKQILQSLYERADYFKPLLKTVNEKFSTNQNGALTELKNSAPQKSDFLNISIALKQALNSDRKLSVIYLENHRNLAREVNKQIRIRNQTRNQGIGILLMMIPILICIAIVGYPWMMYTIRAISQIPI